MVIFIRFSKYSRAVIRVQQTARPTWNEICRNSLVLGVLLHAPEAHEGMSANEITKDSRGGESEVSKGSPAAEAASDPPWPDLEGNAAKCRVANEGLAIYFPGNRVAPIFMEDFSCIR